MSVPAAIAHQADVAPDAAPVRFELAMTGEEGCAVRALGLIVRRGWYLHSAELLPGRPGEARRMTVDVFKRDETRSVETLKRQLERLYDLVGVTVHDPSPAFAQPASQPNGATP